MFPAKSEVDPPRISHPDDRQEISSCYRTSLYISPRQENPPNIFFFHVATDRQPPDAFSSTWPSTSHHILICLPRGITSDRISGKCFL